MPFSRARPHRACLPENLELFSPLFDFGHWKNSSGEPTLTEYKCWVVARGRSLLSLRNSENVRHLTTHQRHASSISGWFNGEEWYQLTSRIQILLYVDGYFDYYATARTLILSLGCLWSGLGFLPFWAAKSTTTTSTFIGIAMSRWHCRIKY